jgi:hypothetical protein
MIPKNISRRHVLRALERIDRDGVDPVREATRFHLVHEGRRYPPKLAIALANELANGVPLPASSFSGGSESNSFLEARGFKVAPFRGPPALPAKRPGRFVSTVLLERSGFEYSERDRLRTTKTIVDALGGATKGRVLLLFPGGWFKAGARTPASISKRIVSSMRTLLKGHGDGRLGASFGLDGRRRSDGTRDQTAIMLTSRAVLAAGRKFYPTKDEVTDAAPTWDAGEGGYPRIGTFDGRRYYLAVCYDGFGIKRQRPPRPKVDAILDHVHGFDASESEVLFARHGFAGASQVWGCPVYGAATFFDRTVPADWPSSVLWRGKPRSTMQWKYADNAIAPADTMAIEVPEGRAVVRLFRVP